MYLTSEKKKQIFQNNEKIKQEGSGSSEGQISLFTYRIQHLTQHLKKNKKDYNTERSLVHLVGKRRRILNYLKNKNIQRYRDIIVKLKIRK